MLRGLKRARGEWPEYMDRVEDERYGSGVFNPTATLRNLTREFSFDAYTGMGLGIPQFRHPNYDDMAYRYGLTLDTMAVTRFRMIWQRFIINLRRLVARRRHTQQEANRFR